MEEKQGEKHTKTRQKRKGPVHKLSRQEKHIFTKYGMQFYSPDIPEDHKAQVAYRRIIRNKALNELVKIYPQWTLHTVSGMIANHKADYVKRLQKRSAPVLNSDLDNEDTVSYSDEDEGDKTNEIFNIEKIINHRKRNYATQYLVKWKGFSEEEATWLYGHDIDEQEHKDLIKKYLEEVKPAKAKEPKTRTSRKNSQVVSDDKSGDGDYAPHGKYPPPPSKKKNQPRKPKPTGIDEIMGLNKDEEGKLYFLTRLTNGKMKVFDNDHMKANYINDLVTFYEKNIKVSSKLEISKLDDDSDYGI